MACGYAIDATGALLRHNPVTPDAGGGTRETTQVARLTTSAPPTSSRGPAPVSSVESPTRGPRGRGSARSVRDNDEKYTKLGQVK